MSPLERLTAIREGTKGAKEEHNALGADMLVNWAEHATPNTFSAAARLYSVMHLADRHRPIANLIISNVPGPDFPLYLAGAEMVAGFPLGPVMDGLGVNITIMSYRGTLYWGIIACPETMPRVWQLAAGIPLALDELLDAADLAPAEFRSREAADACQSATTRGAAGWLRPALRHRTRHGDPPAVIDDAPEHTRMGRPNVWWTAS